MNLLAVIDTFAYMQETQGAIDECGFRYLLSYKIYTFMVRFLPPSIRPSSLTTVDFAWALHSEAEAQLTDIIMEGSNNHWRSAKT